MKRMLVVLVLAFLTAPVSHAQDGRIQKILNRYLEATGGVDAWRSVDALHLTGRVTIDTPVGPLVLAIESWNVYPGYALIRQTTVSAPPEIPNLDQKIFITPDGGWIESAMIGRRMNLSDIPTAQREALDAQRPSFNHASEELAMLDSDSLDASVGDDSTLDGRSVHTILRKLGAVSTVRMYDTESGLLVGIETMTNEGTVIQRVSDYRAVGPVLKPFVMESSNQGMTQRVETETIELRPDLTAEALEAMAGYDQ